MLTTQSSSSWRDWPPAAKLKLAQKLQKLVSQKEALARQAQEAEAFSAELTFRGPQAELQTSQADELVLSGPAGTGKSVACLHKLHRMALKHPGSRWLILRKTRRSLTESGLVTYEKHILGEGNPICAGVQRENRHSYKYPNGSEVITGGIDEPTRLFSTEYDGIYVQECNELSLNDWESLIRPLRNEVAPYQQLMGDCNPDAPGHWLYKRATESKLTTMWHTLHENNPRMHDGAGWTEFGRRYIAKLDRLTGVRYQRLRWGKWVAAEGAVYDEWNAGVHLIQRFPIPATWPRYRAVDFGFGNPFVCLWMAVDPDGRIYVYREIYRTKRLVEDHAANIKRLSDGERIENSACDHDAEDRATLTRHGISNIAAFKSISPGIQAVSARLRIAEDGKPRLYWLRDSLVDLDPDLEEAKLPTSGVQEFDSYMWPKGQDGKSLKEVPVDLHNHAMDALRYGVVMIDRVLGVQSSQINKSIASRAKRASAW